MLEFLERNVYKIVFLVEISVELFCIVYRQKDSELTWQYNIPVLNTLVMSINQSQDF